MTPPPVSLTAPALIDWTPPRGLRAHESTSVIGRGQAMWDRASTEVLRWTVKTRSGFRVAPAAEAVVGARPTVTAGLLGITVVEPVEVVEVVRAADRVGFAYRTRPGHPLDGEEAFIVHRAGPEVRLTIRSLTRPSPAGFWRPLYPALLVAQQVVRRRYRAALRRPG